MPISLDDLQQQLLSEQATPKPPAVPLPGQRPFAQSVSPSGTTQAATTGNPPVSPPGASGSPGRRASLLSRTVDSAVAMMSGRTDPAVRATDAIATAFLRAPGQIVGGLADTENDLGRFIGDNMDYRHVRQHPIKAALAATLAANPITAPFALGGAAIGALRRATGIDHPPNTSDLITGNVSGHGASLADILSMRQTLGRVGNPQVNQIATEGLGILGSLAIPGGGATDAAEGVAAATPTAMRILNGAGHLLVSSAKVGAATAVVGDPRSGRISDLITQAGVHNAVVDYLASHPDDSAAESRLKAGIEGGIANTVLEPLGRGLIAGVKAIRGAMTGDAAAAQGALAEAAGNVPRPNRITEATPEEAAQDNIDRAMATGRTQEARWQGQEQAYKEATADAATDGDGANKPASPASEGEAAEGQAPVQEQTPGTRHTDTAAAAPEGKPSAASVPAASSGGWVAPRPDGSYGQADLYRMSPAQLLRLSETAPRSAEVDAEDVVTREDAAEMYRAHGGPGGFSGWDTDNLIDVLRRNILEQHSPDWVQRVEQGQVKPGEQNAITGEQAAYIQMRGAVSALQDRGFDLNSLPGKLVSNMQGRGWGGADAREVVSHQLEQLITAAREQRVPLIRDANGALERAGAAERLDPETMVVRPDGKIVVQDATKAAADEAGVGRVFAAASEDMPRDPVIFKEEDPQGGQRVVGMMGREDLQALSDDAVDLRDHALDTDDPRTLDVTDSDHPAGQWRIGQLGSSYDVPAVMRAIVDRIPGAARPKSDAELMAAAKAASAALGEDPEDILRSAAAFAGHAGDLDTAMAVHRLVWTQMARDIDGLVGRDVSEMTDADVHDAASKIHNMMTFTTYLEEAKTGIARALRVNALPDADTYLENLEKVGRNPRLPSVLDSVQPGNMPPLPRTPQELKQWLDLWRVTKGDPEARQLFLKGLTFTPDKWKYLRTSFANWFTASIVSGPATFMRDLAGPAAVGAIRTIERTAGGFAASLNPTLTAAQRSDLLAAATQAVPAYIQTIGDSLDALKAGIKATLSGHSLLGGPNPLDLNVSGVPRPLIDAAMAKDPGVTGSVPYLLGNAVNLWPQAVHALHGGVNEFAARLAYNGEVRAQAMLEASQQGLQGADFGRFVRDKLTSAADPLGPARDADALASAQRTTFTRSPDATDPELFQRVNGLVSWLKQNVPEFRYILPIWTVPSNAIGETLRRIPVMNFMLRETQQELAGERGAIAQAESYGRFLSGAALIGAGFGMARTGMITGAGPADAHSRSLWQADGRIPYAIKIGNTWVSYNRLDVVGSMLGIVASTYDHTVYHGPEQNSIFSSVGALAQYFKDQSALEGLSELLSFGGDPNESAGFLDRLARTTASGFVPNFITQMGRNNLDPLARVVHSGPGLGGFANGVWQSILNKLPGASATLDPQRNLLGEDVHRPQGLGMNMLPVTLSSANSYAQDPVIDELDRLYGKTGWAPGVMSPAAGPNARMDLRDAKLEDGHSLYDALMRYRGMSQVDNQSIRQALTDLFQSGDYNEAEDGRGDVLQDDQGNANRGAMISQVFDGFNKQARADVANASPLAARYLATTKAMNHNTAATANFSAHDLAGNAGLMRSLGINISDYEDAVRNP